MRINKKIISKFLSQKDMGWKYIMDELPKFNTPVFIRITSDKKIIRETETEIYLLEDIKLATFIPLENGKPGKWVIEGPFPFIDFSQLSHNESINKDSYVTHWCIASEEEYKQWKNIFKFYSDYKNLHIIADEDKMKIIYKSLSKAAYVLSYLDNDSLSNLGIDSEIRNLYCNTIYDLMTSIDIDNGGK